MKTPLVYVYTDQPMCSIDCVDATCDVLNSSGIVEAKMIGPDSFPLIELNEENLHKASCIVFPGGDGDADQFDNSLIFKRKLIEDYVSSGGRYLGICQGAYFAGKHFFNLLRGFDAVQHIKRNGAQIKRSGSNIIDIKWKDERIYPIYFHDGAAFVTTSEQPAFTNILAHYLNGDVACLIQAHKKGRVGVIGPHPEAQKWWFYSQTKIKNGWTYCIQTPLLVQLIQELLA